MAKAAVNQFTLTNPALVGETIDNVLDRIALEVLRDAKLYAPRSSRQPAPKNPAAPVTGNLKNSIQIDKQNQGDEHIRYIGTNVHYGLYQEFGTSRMVARPFMGPALEHAREKWA